MDMQALVIGILTLGAGLPMALSPRRKRLAAQAQHAARKAALDAGDDERFFEERRTLDAYPPARTDRGWQIKGGLLMLVGTALIVIGLYR